MKRFKNILVLYNLAVGAEETLQRAISLAERNDAKLTVLHVINPTKASLDVMQERRRLMSRVCAGIALPQDRVDMIVRRGDLVDEILDCVSNFGIDLIVLPTEQGQGLAKLVGVDTAAEVMRCCDCPIWVVRNDGEGHYRTIVAAVNAGKEDAFECSANRRILEMSASLAQREGADLHVLYVWDYDQETYKRLQSELPDSIRNGLEKEGRFKALQQVIDLSTHVLGSPLRLTPVVKQGDVEDEILKYVEDKQANLLVTEGTNASPLINAIVGNRNLRLLNRAECSVMVSRPAGEAIVETDLGAERPLVLESRKNL